MALGRGGGGQAGVRPRGSVFGVDLARVRMRAPCAGGCAVAAQRRSGRVRRPRVNVEARSCRAEHAHGTRNEGGGQRLCQKQVGVAGQRGNGG